jgi:hypothetical protein
MKKTFLLVAIIILGITASVSGQIVKPFPDSTGAWRIVGGSLSSWPDPPIPFTFRYFINGDTIVNGVSYAKLYKGSSNLFDTTFNNYSEGLKGLFRVVGDQVYYKHTDTADFLIPFDTSEVLLYDFSLNVGDTIKYYRHGVVVAASRVTSVDTVVINGEPLRRWNFMGGGQYLLQQFWIEGIGSDLGFFPYHEKFEGGLHLACFHQAGEDYPVQLYGASSCETVDIMRPEFKPEFRLFPNPSKGTFVIEPAGYSGEAVQIAICNTAGMLLRTLETHDTSISIDLSDQPDGVFILHFITGQTHTTKKLVLLRY